MIYLFRKRLLLADYAHNRFSYTKVWQGRTPNWRLSSENVPTGDSCEHARGLLGRFKSHKSLQEPWDITGGPCSARNQSYCFYKIFLKNNSTNDRRKMQVILLLDWKKDFLDTRSYFLTANQNARHNQSKFAWCHNRVYMHSTSYTHLNNLNIAIDQWKCAHYPNYCIKMIKQRIYK